MRILIGMLVIAVILGCGGSSGSGSKGPVTLEGRFPVDGTIDFAAFAVVNEADLDFIDINTLAFVKSTHVKWAVTWDDRDIYIVVEWTDDTFNNDSTLGLPMDNDIIQLLVDNDGDGTFEDNEDKKGLLAAADGSFYMDEHKSSGVTEDVIGDGRGYLKYLAGDQKYQAEFLFPLADDAQGEDGVLDALSRMNIVFLDAFTGTDGNSAALDPDLDVSTNWEVLDITSVATLPRTEIPAGLTGLIVFTSEHEDPEGEIYTFDPLNGTLFRVTNNTDFEANVSLSHDRQWISYHGAPNMMDISQYEIYKVPVTGGAPTQMTSNAYIDGHPGWSPDDSVIVYAAFRDAGKASIVTMNAGTAVEIADLTPPAWDENDPDYLPDGRIIFKTNRFSTLPEIRIAVMDDDGGNLTQVTSVSGVVDHDPVGDMTWTIYERLMTAKDYAADTTSLFDPWHIIETRLDGAVERTVVGDVFVNWLPVYDPSGNYIVYLRTNGYTEARLLTRTGVDLGRLIPDITKITYIDWK